jgi:LPS-assembly protein
MIGPLGQVFTPFTYVQADLSWISPDDSEAGLAADDLIPRGMPAAGLQYEWPFLATIGSTVHTFGPKAQIIARPDERHAGDLPNNDAQSLVFDDTNLFEWDKFSGYDRQEGGTRANLGLVYQGLFPNGASIDALVGQSFHLAGVNSFTMNDHALTGLGSGLENDESDYVGRIMLNTGTGLALIGRGRLDEDTLEVNRAEVNAIGAFGDSVASLGYAFIRESPSAGVFEDREEVSGAAALEIVDDWSVLGAITYDLENESRVSQSFGLAYNDECIQISAVYSETPDRYTDLTTDRQVYVRVNLRTLGDDTLNSAIDDQLN